ncbi:MAG: response regulator [Archangium sp.]|nr:response regulator [Archangium sp.]
MTALLAIPPKPRVLCVDDEPGVLEGLMFTLRRKFDVLTATSGAKGLELLAQERSVAVVISDMRMPEMDGAAFLARARVVAPHASRLLLTGHADLPAAITAVNEGQLFRFLQKPTPAPMLLSVVEAATEQNRLLTAEKELLEQTLQGCLKTLTDVLSFTAPHAFGRASRVKRILSRLLDSTGVTERWRCEIAALVAPLGAVTLSDELTTKVHERVPLTAAEEKLVAAVPQVTEQLLANIPRLEGVRRLLTLSAMPLTAEQVARDALGREALLLRAATELERRLATTTSPDEACALLLAKEPALQELASALVAAARAEKGEVHDIGLAALRVGMVFVEDVRLNSGGLLVPRGFAVTASFLERCRNYQEGVIRVPLRVLSGTG